MTQKETAKMTTTEAPTAPWRITWRGQSWAESDLTGQHLAVLALITGRDDYDMLEISPVNGHQRLMMLIAACVTVDRTMGADPESPDEIATTVAESVDEVSKASVDEILGALTFD